MLIFSVIYRQVRDDMLNLDEMPEYFDAMTSRIKYGTDAVLQNIKVEMSESRHDSKEMEIPM